jgi:hypothetical protein
VAALVLTMIASSNPLVASLSEYWFDSTIATSGFLVFCSLLHLGFAIVPFDPQLFLIQFSSIFGGGVSLDDKIKVMVLCAVICITTGLAIVGIVST